MHVKSFGQLGDGGIEIPMRALEDFLHYARALDNLAAHASRSLGTDFGGTTTDGAVTLDQVFCLGNCALGPSVMVGDRVYGRVDADRLDALVGSARVAAGVPGP